MLSSLLLGLVLSVYNCWFYSTVIVPSWLFSTDFGTCLYQCSLFSFTRLSLHILKCSWAQIPSCLFTCFSFPNSGHADMMWYIVPSNFWHSLHLLCVSLCNIFVAWYFVCNAWFCAASISLSVSAFSSLLDRQRYVPSLLISYYHHQHHYLLYAGYLYLYSRDKLCP
jgi:hypothetical protein